MSALSFVVHAIGACLLWNLLVCKWKNNTMLLNKAILSMSYYAYFSKPHYLSMGLDLQLDAWHSKYTDGNSWGVG